MLHHIPRYLARELDTPGVEKVALVVLDGLACDQWVVLREVLVQQRPVALSRSSGICLDSYHHLGVQAGGFRREASCILSWEYSSD